MLRMTAVGMKDVPVVLVTVATEFGSWLVAGKLALADMLSQTQNKMAMFISGPIYKEILEKIII